MLICVDVNFSIKFTLNFTNTPISYIPKMLKKPWIFFFEQQERLDYFPFKVL